MKKPRATIPGLLISLLALALSACGGGENEEGALSPLGISPDTIELSWAQDPAAPEGTPPFCGNVDQQGNVVPSFATRVFINGGAGPYRLQNSQPEVVFLRDQNGKSIGSVDAAGGSFDVYVGVGCVDPATVNVTDSLGREVSLTVTSAPSEGE